MDLGIGEWKPQGIGSRTGEENVAVGSRMRAKAVREYKPQGDWLEEGINSPTASIQAAQGGF